MTESSASASRLYRSLLDLIEALDDGERLPTVRALMAEHRVGQAVVQEAFQRLKEDGLISSQVGRGSFVTRPDKRPAVRSRSGEIGSLLILSSATMNERAMRVQSRIIDEMRAQGGSLVQLTWHDSAHLLDLLQSIPSFDAAILQSHFEVMPLRVLALLQRKARALVVDGHSIAGLDMDRVGIDWEEAIAAALDHLTELGHRRIRLICIDSEAQPVLQARRYFARLRDWRGHQVQLDQVVLSGHRHPSLPVAQALAPHLATLTPGAPQRPTALMTLGISDALGLREALTSAGLKRPSDISVAVLGHPDVATEHLGEFTIFGGTHLEAAQELFTILRHRLRDPEAPPSIRYLKIHQLLGKSTAPPSS